MSANRFMNDAIRRAAGRVPAGQPAQQAQGQGQAPGHAGVGTGTAVPHKRTMNELIRAFWRRG